MEQKYIFLLIAVLLLFLLALLALLGFAFYALLRLHRQDLHKQTIPAPHATKMDELITAVKQVKSEIEKGQEISKGNFCKLHPGIKAAGTCGICEEMFCEDCLMEFDRITFCPEHFRLVNNGQWAVIDEVKTDPNHPELGVHIYDFKRQAWKEKMTPMYIVTHYQINVEHDFIESQVSLFGPRDEQFFLASELKKYKDKKAAQ